MHDCCGSNYLLHLTYDVASTNQTVFTLMVVGHGLTNQIKNFGIFFAYFLV